MDAEAVQVEYSVGGASQACYAVPIDVPPSASDEQKLTVAREALVRAGDRLNTILTERMSVDAGSAGDGPEDEEKPIML